MNYAEIKEALQLGYCAKIPIMIWGHHGMGKSQLVKELATEENRGFVDFRAAQVEASDLRGWPSKENGRTVYNPPKELPTEGEGYLFLDELNRADDPVIQASFQLVVERKIGEYRLPDGWMPVAAGNYTQGYRVNDFCQAFIGRWCHLELTKSEEYVGDWARHLMNRYGESSSKIIQFIGVDFDNLCSREAGVLDFKIEPSPRLWEMLAKVESVASKFRDEIVSAIRKGLIGRELAIQYENANFSIQPRDLVNKGVKILENVKIKPDQMKGLIWGVVAYIKSTYLKDSKSGPKWSISIEHGKNVYDFMEYLMDKGEADLALVLITQLLKAELQQPSAGAAVVSNHNIAKILAQGNGSAWLKELPNRKRIFELTKKIREE